MNQDKESIFIIEYEPKIRRGLGVFSFLAGVGMGCFLLHYLIFEHLEDFEGTDLNIFIAIIYILGIGVSIFFIGELISYGLKTFRRIDQLDYEGKKPIEKQEIRALKILSIEETKYPKIKPNRPIHKIIWKAK